MAAVTETKRNARLRLLRTDYRVSGPLLLTGLVMYTVFTTIVNLNRPFYEPPPLPSSPAGKDQSRVPLEKGDYLKLRGKR